MHSALSGVVTDAQKKPLASASLKLVQEETERERIAVANARGEFAIAQLSPGPYRIEVEAQGYRKHIQRFVLQVNQEIRIDIPLIAGRMSEVIQVTGAAELLRTESAALGTTIENRLIQSLPLDGRNFFELSLLVPGAVSNAQGSAGSVRGDFAINVNGAREDGNSFLLDGVYNGDPKLNAVGSTPPVDAIREFEVLTSTYDASFGRNAGGQINVIVQSGSNTIHGTAYEYLRARGLDSTNYFAPKNEPDPEYLRNQFGFSFGGPLRKNKTFFFEDYEGRRVNEGITKTTNVPTALERAGDFSQSDPRRPPIDLFTFAPFPNSRIPASRLNPVGKAIASLYPLNNRTVPDQNFVSSPPLIDRDHRFDLRVDHALTRKDELAARFSFGDRMLFDPFSGQGNSVVPGYGTNIPRRSQNAMLSETHVFSPSVINEVRLGFNRVALGAYQEKQGTSTNKLIGIPEISSNARDYGLTYITINGYSPIGDEVNNPQHSVTNTYQINDQATWTSGRHLVKLGLDVRLLQQNAYRDIESRGFISFSGATGNALAEMLQGFPSVSGGATSDNPQHLRTHSYNFFVNDTWRIRHNLTLSYGVRYEYNTPPVDPLDRANLYDPASKTLVKVGSGNAPRGGFEGDKNNFAPRLGLAWSKGGTVVRTGYGIYFDQSALAPGEGLYFSPPYFNLKFYFSYPPLVTLFLQDPFPTNFPFPTPSSALAIQRNLSTGYLQHFNFNVQRQLGRSRVFEIGYAGSKGTKLLAGRDINQPRASAAQQNPRPVQLFGDITELESRANSNYHSLQARFQQRLHAGLSILAAYTYSKSIDDASGFFASAGDPNFPQDSNYLRAERGLSNFDARQRLSFSYSYDLPFARKSRLWGGWQTNGVWSFQSGHPFTVALLPDVDNSNTGRSSLGFGANDRPNRIASGILSNPSPDKWFDTAAFKIPAFGNFGNSGRNILDGPGQATINLSLIKNTVFHERWTGQFRLEAFNIFDRANFNQPDNFVGSPTFGRILSAQSPRRIQFGFKLLF